MNILTKEILPLFDIFTSNKVINQQLTQNDVNEYSFYVELEDIYFNKTQELAIPDREIKISVPLHYNQIILKGKGYYNQDMIINVCSKLNPNLIRVNRHDLLILKTVTSEKDENSLELDHFGESIEIKLEKGKILYKIEKFGLPVNNEKRGSLYVMIKVGDQEFGEELDYLLDILEYDPNCNIRQLDISQ